MKIIKNILAVIGIDFIFYTIGAFIEWNLNPEYWDSALRGVMILLSFFFIAMYAVFNTKDENDENK